ncbi:MAG: disulfide reductase [Bdellovibrionales bacterium RIFOXYD12_FULL_39_22]|nr:MAG: disulfide reductase [Bdellovibrionales bacterium RIFOXYB1_FULL_39_21]OFZ43165.1 MAG: disulfide reductase [Bdellovibrionales bacterium RIFOXYC12_FULL_39_17]OFZ47903.1 MAG: disulfide reductase [Bdellovibrionales bacterium RIFOXYC1_FULL_39_130]OFZ75683.1 MAG: disulfide reductase [Bdellovibrionales bacterium RIFOXYD1_FULL_39_84]OFZ94173.1 MAG: disulfide reductase [Bdellovibrionales bacterium RIFOXYD12_FULL_39_22]HLE11761.1 CoB--CoM heterodisulfide reductase iron-sulfur subunit A family pro
MSRIGVFVCHCGENIGRTVDCGKVALESGKLQNVAISIDYKYMCSSPGQELIKNSIREHGLDGVVVAACSPRMHEKTFRGACAQAALNPYLCEMANIREHCSWVHDDKEAATAKAMDIVRSLVAKTVRNEKLFPIKIPVTKRALVIGGGVGGIQTALDIANSGHEVILIDKSPSIGGRMAALSETFPTLDCSQCILTPKMVDVAQHSKIKLVTYAELESVEGFVGNFKVKIRQKARYVDPIKCTGCGLCSQKCPVKNIASEFDEGLGMRRAIYTPFPQAIPNRPVIDKNNCTKLKTGKCGVCQKICQVGAINYEDKDQIVEYEVGAIVVATGLRALETREIYPEYGQGRHKDIITAMQFERLASASGPTLGVIKRPSDGKVPEKIVFIQCAGSRDSNAGYPYCSKICCMYTAKHAMLYKHKVHDGKAFVFYMDIRACGKNYEEFVRRGIEEDETSYLRGRVAKIYEENGQLVVNGIDTLSGEKMSIKADMVVLATAMSAQLESVHLAQLLGISYDQNNFYSELHPKLNPVDTATAGIFLAGSCAGPRDIPDTVASAGAVAAKVGGLFSKELLEREPIVACTKSFSNMNTCSGCFSCLQACPYGAIEQEIIVDKKQQQKKMVAKVNQGLCQGCGSCVSICRAGCLDLKGFSDEQMYESIIGMGGS